MEKLFKKKKLTIEEAKELDSFLSKNVFYACYSMDNKMIIDSIKKIEDALGHSCFKMDLQHNLFQEVIDAKFSFYDKDIEQYKKFHELIYTFGFEDCGLSYVIGDYLLDKNFFTYVIYVSK